jgi:hypothetical protein
VGNGQNLPINTIGNTHLYTQTHKFCLNNVLHVPEIASNLLSVNKLCHDNNCSCFFDSHKFSVKDLLTGKILYKGLSENGVYPIYSSKFGHLRAIAQLSSHVHSSVYTSIKSNNTGTTSASSTKNWLLWHHRLGHLSARILHSVFPNLSSYNSLTKEYAFVHYNHCLSGKLHRLPFTQSITKSLHPFHLLHVDLWGPATSVATNIIPNSIGFIF